MLKQTDKSRIKAIQSLLSQSQREELKKKCAEYGSKLSTIGCSFLPYVKNVGRAELRTQHDGKRTVTIYPSMQYRRLPKLMPNLKVAEGEENPMARERSMFERAFLNGRQQLFDECLEASEYYFEDGIRKVRPYFMVMETIVRGLPEPMKFEDYLCKVMGSDEFNKADRALKAERTFLNCVPIKENDFVFNDDVLASIGHRHELAVLNEPIQIIHEDDEVLVVNKPATIPQYPVGKYRFNSLVFILAKEMGYKNLKNVHRLDKNTSGVCIFSKGSSPAKLQAKLHLPNSQKEYIALVEGLFPPEKVQVDHPLTTNFFTNVRITEATPKPSLTIFERIEYDPDTNTSLVLCQPKTGRTHQIRRHLRILGFPIINDYIYNDIDKKARFQIGDAMTLEATVKRLSNRRETSKWAPKKEWTSNDTWKEALSHNVGMYKVDCLMCHLGSEFERKASINSLTPMCLHSNKYLVDGQLFEAPWPQWATDRDYLKSHILNPRSENKIDT